MFSENLYKQRRKQLSKDVENGVILICGNNNSPRNYTSNYYRFRQDSNFLYFAGIDLPGLNLIINTSTGKSTLYGNDVDVEDAIWTGPQPGLRDWADKAGIEDIKPANKLPLDLPKEQNIHFLPVYRHDRMIYLSEILKKSTKEIGKMHSDILVKAVIKQRSIKSNEEILQIEDALNRATGKFHIEAMKMNREDVKEYQIAGQIESTMLKNNCSAAYGIICSVHGEILHNEHYNNTLKSGQLLLIDAGAENSMHYASDITRTSPVNGRFSPQQKQVYNIVLKALNDSINAIKPGIAYRKIHFEAAKIITRGLKELGLMKGNIEDAVKNGAHALFFPHGLGHMMGLDVHDMEDLGEDNVGYNDITKRSKQFGTAFLRLGRELEEDFVITVEPGIYFIPPLIDKWKTEKKYTDFINYTEVEKYKGFGGIRIEDNVLVNKTGCRILGKPVPKTVNEIEEIMKF